MRRLVRNLHTIRQKLKRSGDCARLADHAKFCVAPNSFSETNQGVTKFTHLSRVGLAARTVTQQVRMYAPTAGSAASKSICWNCQKNSGRKNHMLCISCGHLQDVDMGINYFDLLNFPKTFAVEQKELTRRFRQLQTLVHPDKFSNKTLREQNNSADWSALLNKAYKTLSAPIERGQYILKLIGEQLPQDNSALDKEFLMQMMERNEEVEDANTSDELQRLDERIAQEMSESADELGMKFGSNAVKEAKSLLVKMKYLLSLQKSVKNKMQSLMGG